MKIEITQTQPSNFIQPLQKTSKTYHQNLNKTTLIIGRGETLSIPNQLENNENEYLNNTQTFEISHQSISRKHAAILFPYHYMKGKWDAGFELCGSIILPKYYRKIEFFGKLCEDLLGKIRSYSSPEKVIIIKDLNSKFGVYKEIKELIIPSKGNSPHPKECLQLGNENIVISSLQTFLNEKEMELAYKSLQQEIKKNVKLVTNMNLELETVLQPNIMEDLQQDKEKLLQMKENECIKCLTLSHVSPLEGKETAVFMIALKIKDGEESEKVSVGRHPRCNIQINKSEISRKQLEISINKMGNWLIEDTNSKNKTWVKKTKIKLQIDSLKVESSCSEELSASHMFYDSECSDLPDELDIASDKLKCITIKLGEVRLDMNISGINYVEQELISRVSGRFSQEREDYTRILENVSGITEQEHEDIPNEQNKNNFGEEDVNERFWEDLHENGESNENILDSLF